MLPNRSEFPIIHDVLDDDEDFGFQFIWDHINTDPPYAMCYLPILNTQIIVRPLEHDQSTYMVNINNDFSIYGMTSFYDVLSAVEKKVRGQVLMFLFNATNLNQLIELQGKNTLHDQVIKLAQR